VTIFFESSAGIAFLHRLLIAMLIIFHTDGGCGLPSILDKAQSKKISASVKALAIEQIVFRVILINIILKTIFQSRGFEAAQIS
jgi:hypothetical protein